MDFNCFHLCKRERLCILTIKFILVFDFVVDVEMVYETAFKNYKLQTSTGFPFALLTDACPDHYANCKRP